MSTEALNTELKYNQQGLIPVVVQDSRSKKVLMVAWMNHEALQKTLHSGAMWYWSRSRRCLWKKGETSGNTQRLVSMQADCDKDCLLASVEQKGVACHTGAESCFFNGLI